ncbi:Non-functional pseudokinase ZED1 [Vitis vinifera]|uniref:Non-functional pseudokinase ZED1 n=1 Tax=Vitis vinifera TaxID=29760 RepID=A0A438D7Y3_VITVI|nr:Non-functional pseudokinase ZED1 [Vitis vinifera]
MGKGKKEEKKENEEYMLNGGLLLEKRISYFGGRYSNPIRNFSIQEIQRATDTFNENLIFNDDVSSLYKWYKGSLEGRVIRIRKIGHTGFRGDLQIVTNEIAVATQMSSHKNALKLLGCCLETQIPILVYEFSSCEPLAKKIFDCNEPFPWKSRLKIAYEIASVIAYLHTAFPRPIIHRGIKPSHFFWTMVLLPNYPISDFRLPFHKVNACGRCMWDFVMEGVSMRKYVEDHMENYGINDILDSIILVEGGGVLEQQQFQAVYQLALKCTEEFAEERPTIVDAAKKLDEFSELCLNMTIWFATSQNVWTPLNDNGYSPADVS